MMTIGKRIQKILKEKGWKQVDLILKTGIQQATMSSIIRDKPKNPRDLNLIARALGVSEAWLRFGEGNPDGGWTILPHVRIPVFQWGDKFEVEGNSVKQEYMVYALCHGQDKEDIEKNCFLVDVKSDEMDSNNTTKPPVRIGELVLINTARKPKNSDIVLIEINGDRYLRQYIKSGTSVSYYASNEKKHDIIKMREGQVKTIGVVIEKAVRAVSML